jgi:hypothetical protein
MEACLNSQLQSSLNTVRKSSKVVIGLIDRGKVVLVCHTQCYKLLVQPLGNETGVMPEFFR